LTISARIQSISRLRTFSDGDGITTLIGFEGCPLRCAYCFNPSSWDGSGISRSYTPDGLYREIKRDNLYFLATGGGLTFAGGEPLIHHDFIRNFIEKYGSTGWKFSIETSLAVKRKCLENVYQLMDFFIVDAKDMNPERYEIYTGGNFNRFIENLEFLKENVDTNRIRVRVPRIAILHKGREAQKSQSILKDMGFDDIEIFDYVNPEMMVRMSDEAARNMNKFIESIDKREGDKK